MYGSAEAKGRFLPVWIVYHLQNNTMLSPFCSIKVSILDKLKVFNIFGFVDVASVVIYDRVVRVVDNVERCALNDLPELPRDRLAFESTISFI